MSRISLLAVAAVLTIPAVVAHEVKFGAVRDLARHWTEELDMSDVIWVLLGFGAILAIVGVIAAVEIHAERNLPMDFPE